MKTTSKQGFKAVDYMRQVREGLSALYAADKKRFHDELKGAMEDFKRKRSSGNGQHEEHVAGEGDGSMQIA